MRHLEIDQDYTIDILLRLLQTPSPSGYTDRVVHLVADELERLGVDFELTRRGAIRATLKGKESSPDRAVVA
ncbi:MAG: osmoprotectant NAGGN system M42 family peptidase, partial [Gammaproteobacteria bacterium]